MKMTYTPHGRHLIAGEWVGGSESFTSSPSQGEPNVFCRGSADLIDCAAQAAEEAFPSYSATTRQERAAFLNAIADQIENRAGIITQIATAESGLPATRLEAERGRTTGQLRLFAHHILRGDYLDRRVEAAVPDRSPNPRPELRTIQRPIGPVGVFGASNFPLAFSTAGGDTASALAAGCPVVVKGHEAHPGTAEIIAVAIHAAITVSNLHPGVFSLVQGGAIAVGQTLVQHPLIKAIGFTGSLRAGRALFDLCTNRAEPIPFFGELGSINPMFMLPGALAAAAGDLGAGWAASLTMGAGQFCTNPGVIVALNSPDTDAFVAAATQALSGVGPQIMLTVGIADAYRQGVQRVAATSGVRALLSPQSDARTALPHLYETTGAHWLNYKELSEEVFGPLGIVVKVTDADQMLAVAKGLQGQLTCTLHLSAADHALARTLLPVLERKAGRILVNGFPTGVEVADAMVHSGPYPASTNFGATSVGTLAIRRFLRPVCYQDVPVALLPIDAA